MKKQQIAARAEKHSTLTVPGALPVLTCEPIVTRRLLLTLVASVRQLEKGDAPWGVLKGYHKTCDVLKSGRLDIYKGTSASSFRWKRIMHARVSRPW